jgi:hypothetical protein
MRKELVGKYIKRENYWFRIINQYSDSSVEAKGLDSQGIVVIGDIGKYQIFDLILDQYF